jgi:hypothetical protein
MKPLPKFSDSFTTTEAKFSVDVATPHGETAEAIVVEIDCAGKVWGDEDTIDLFIEMLTHAKENLVWRRIQREAAAKQRRRA